VYLCFILLNGVAGIQKEMKQIIVSTYANRLLPVGIFFLPMEILNIDESHELERCEVVIKQGLKTFIEVGEALFIIRDKRLYRREFNTFEDYCQEKWSMPRRHVNRMIAASETIINLGPMGPILPESERQVRPLTSLEPEIQKEVWKEVVETHGKNITASKVQEIVEHWKPLNEEVKEAKEMPIFSNSISEIIETNKPKAHVSNNSGENEWYTPECYIESAKLVMGSIDLDPASSIIANEIVKANKFYTQDEDGLSFDWYGNVWMNPPYAQPLIFQFISKLIESKEINQAIVLVNNGTETQWGQLLLSNSSAVCFHQSRIRFIDKYGNLGQAPLQGQIICYIGSNIDNFVNEFKQYGTVLTKR
jgi:ParB family chromosome partitioning protein